MDNGEEIGKVEVMGNGQGIGNTGAKSRETTIAIRASRTGGHRAGFDAFMTGFVFCHFVAKFGRFRDLPSRPQMSDLGMQDFQNKITLSGKDIPLQIMKSNFAKTSKEHSDKIAKLKIISV